MPIKTVLTSVVTDLLDNMKSLNLNAFILIVVCVLMQLPLKAYAYENCSDDVAAVVAKNTGIRKEKAESGVAVSAACKTWPHDPKTILSAFAFDEGNEYEKVLVVAIVDSKSKRVISSYKRVVVEDSALHFGQFSLGIDTAPYHLSKDVRAFGIRFSSDARGAGCAGGVWSDELTLFVPVGAALRPVLQGLAMTRSEARKGCFGGATPELVYDEAKLSLSLAKTSSNGFADLIATARINEDGDGTPGETRQRVERYVLRYDGKEYKESKDVPWWLSFFRPE